MTKNHNLKSRVRALKAVTGVPYSVARRQLAGPTLADVLREYPALNSFGMGAFAPMSKPRGVRLREIEAGRLELLDRECEVRAIAAWLKENIAPIKTPTVGSYTMKHVVEYAMGRYLMNGELIAAALMAGYPMKIIDGPNPLFGMSARDVRRYSRR